MPDLVRLDRYSKWYKKVDDIREQNLRSPEKWDDRFNNSSSGVVLNFRVWWNPDTDQIKDEAALDEAHPPKHWILIWYRVFPKNAIGHGSPAAVGDMRQDGIGTHPDFPTRHPQTEAQKEAMYRACARHYSTLIH